MGTRMRFWGAGILAAALVPMMATSASAAPPANDESSGAVPLAVGAHVVQDTTQATTTAADAVLNEECGAPATNASVWYSFTPATDRNVVLDVSASDYTAGVMVFEGPPSGDSLIDCAPDQVALPATAHQTYYFMVFSDSAVNGGRLVLDLAKAPPPPKVHITLSGRGLAYRGGAARVRGTYFCKGGETADIYGTIVQRVGRMKIPAEFYRELSCNGHRHRWSARAVSATGIYAPGRARVRATVDSCGPFVCRDDSAKRVVRLRRAGHAGAHRLLTPTTRLALPRPLVDQQRRWVDR